MRTGHRFNQGKQYGCLIIAVSYFIIILGVFLAYFYFR